MLIQQLWHIPGKKSRFILNHKLWVTSQMYDIGPVKHLKVVTWRMWYAAYSCKPNFFVKNQVKNCVWYGLDHGFWSAFVRFRKKLSSAVQICPWRTDRRPFTSTFEKSEDGLSTVHSRPLLGNFSRPPFECVL